MTFPTNVDEFISKVREVKYLESISTADAEGNTPLHTAVEGVKALMIGLTDSYEEGLVPTRSSTKQILMLTLDQLIEGMLTELHWPETQEEISNGEE